MTSVVQRLWPDAADLRAAPAAFLRTHAQRLREITPWRVGRELLAIAVIVVLDVYPGWFVGENRLTSWSVVWLGAVYVGLYLLRLGFPAIALLVGIWVVFTVEHGGLATIIMLSYAAGYRIVSWQRALVTAALGLALHMIAFDVSAPGLTGTFGSWVMLTVYGMAVALPFLVGRYSAQRNALVAALHDREETLSRERRMVARQVRLRERNRIAQDMHDSLGHRLSLISVHAGALALDTGLGERQRDAVQVLRSAALTGMEELRGVIGVLRRDEPDEDQVRRTVDAIDELVEGARRAGVRVSLVRGGQPCPLPAKVSHAAYRIAQEGLTNASKHAPGASVQVTVKYEPDALVVEVRNNPPRVRPADGSGFGLIGLRERVRLAGGMLHVGELPTGGFRIAAVLPYEDTAASGDEPADDLPVEPAKPTGIRKWAGVGSILLAGIVVVVVVGGYTWLGTQPVKRVVGPALYDSIQVGESESAVLARLPQGAEPPIGELKSDAAPEPPGARCEYLVADDQTYSARTTKVVRFCFADGRLVEKNTHQQGT
ncbi:signal transduction histidine kinase [Saccharothrix tamanrassetensis]|uniref:histidine kinase n=1 Tax=Saccharothrix tamanrassetensis TaxID=1051531 RepID=A0A841CDY6_9PSEU|nr:sensor histidine kinase [Saccharothrix tamanrassetensis]MBB5955569.1 signal transduction histidine kinase [Saccharothrix tamanrassetensis]